LLDPIRTPSPTKIASPTSFAAANLANRVRQHCGTGISPDRDTTGLGAMLLGFARLCRHYRPTSSPKWRKTRVFPGTEAKSGGRRTVCWREPDSNHRYRSYERVSRTLPNGDAGLISWMGSLSTGRLARRRWLGGPPLHGRLFDGGTDGSNPSSSSSESVANRTRSADRTVSAEGSRRTLSPPRA
jgi:hypothetical protein